MRLLIVGAGGHAKVVADAARSAGVGVSVLGTGKDPDSVLGIPVLREAERPDADFFIVAVGDNRSRATLYERWLERGLQPASVVHPSAVVADSARVGPGTFIAAGVVVNAEADIGANAILNTGCTVDHDCRIGDHAHIGPGASLCGAVGIGEGALVGVGACASPGVAVGAWSVVGAGAAITVDLPGNAVCVGVPARPVRNVDDGS